MDELAERIFRLAYFIHADRANALKITGQVLRGRASHCARRRKRLYYRLRGRFIEGVLRRGSRTKVIAEELQLVQELVYGYSQQLEREQEQGLEASALTDEDLLIRFVERLVSVTVSRNSFHVVLGLCRLLYDYSNDEAVAVYDVVLQDPHGGKDAVYFRKRKRVLIREMKQRFGDLLRLCHAGHNEERFVSRADSTHWAGLVHSALDRFTPWDTDCVLPETLNPGDDEIPPLRFESADPNEEYRVEARRAHTLLHPGCLQRLTDALKLDRPCERLAVPVFFSQASGKGGNGRGNDEGGSGMRNDRDNPTPLQPDELAELRESVARDGARRRKDATTVLSVVIDGIERARLGLDDAQPKRVVLEPEARLLEIQGRDEIGELLLGSLLLTQRQLATAERLRKFSFKLVGGRRVSFSLSPELDEEGDIDAIELILNYRTTGLMASLAGLFTQRTHPPTVLAPRRSVAPLILAAAVIALLLMTTIGLLLSRRTPPRPVAEEMAKVTLPTEAEGYQPAAAQPPSADTTPEENVTRDSPRRQPTPRPHKPKRLEEGARSFAPRAGRLSSVRRVYVEAHDEATDEQRIHEHLSRALADSRRFQTVPEPQEAEAYMLWSVRSGKTGSVLTLRLRDRQGKTLWKTTQALSDNTQFAPAVNAAIRNLLVRAARVKP